MRRIALFSDVHGNLPALDAALADLETAGIGEVYCLGDLVGYGPDPAGVVDRIRSLGIPTIRGNYDDGIGNRRGECGCYYVTEQAKSDGAASYAFTDAALDDRDRAWLAALPDEIRLSEGHVRILLPMAVHARSTSICFSTARTRSSPDSPTKQTPMSSASAMSTSPITDR